MTTRTTAPPEALPDDVGQVVEFSRAVVALAVRSIGAIDGQVTLPQFRSLAVLERTGSCNVSGLAEGLGLHISTVTRICDKLVEQGLISRQPRSDDRREIMLANTDVGSRLVATVFRAREAEVARALDRLHDDERQAVRAALPLLLRVLGEGADGPNQPWG